MGVHIDDRRGLLPDAAIRALAASGQRAALADVSLAKSTNDPVPSRSPRHLGECSPPLHIGQRAPTFVAVKSLDLERGKDA